MTVHRVFYQTSQDADSYLIDQWIPQWLTNYQPWEDEGPNEPPTLTPPAPEGDEPQRYQATWRFVGSANKESILQDLDGYSAAYSPWHLIYYEACDHDSSSDTRTHCEWDESETRKNGDIPTAVVEGG